MNTGRATFGSGMDFCSVAIETASWYFRQLERSQSEACSKIVSRFYCRPRRVNPHQLLAFESSDHLSTPLQAPAIGFATGRWCLKFAVNCTTTIFSAKQTRLRAVAFAEFLSRFCLG